MMNIFCHWVPNTQKNNLCIPALVVGYPVTLRCKLILTS